MSLNSKEVDFTKKRQFLEAVIISCNAIIILQKDLHSWQRIWLKILIIPALMNSGLTLEDARDYRIIGYVEPQEGGTHYNFTVPHV